MPNFRPYEPDQHLLLPPSLRDWLPPDHLLWFISDSVDQLDLSEIVSSYRDGGQGNLPYHPAMMLKILVYAYATGTFSSRLEERKRREADEKAKDRDDDSRPRGGQRRKHPVGTPKPKDQENFTDPESRIMKDGRGAFEQCYNTGIAVDEGHRLIVANTVQQSAADARTLIPLVDQTKRNTRRRVQSVLADAGYASEANLRDLERRKITGYVALGREGKSKAPKPKPTATAKQRMASRLKSKRGRAKYKRRKHIAEPPFGWMKRGLGFRQFSLRGLSKVAGEFNLLCLALDLRRMSGLMKWT